ncbi:Metallo-dependent phosphatase, partial [Morchella conica CCBAS932]
PHPSNLDQFLAAPTPFLARVLYNSLPAQRRQPHPPPQQQHGDPEETLTVVCVSDTHGQMPPLPTGDLLLHSGDLTASGTMGELRATLQWIASQPHRYKVVIAGNRELCLDEESRGRSLGISHGPGAHDEKGTSTTTSTTIDWEKLSAAGLVYLQNSSITLHFPAPRDRCIKIFGSPLSPRHHSPHAAFQYTPTEHPWHGLIPPDTDIVLTHTPPQCHLDSWRRFGCGALLRELWRVRPALHVFGHVHAGYGVEVVRWDEMQRLYEGACAG